MSNEWISIKDLRKPEINTWIEVIHSLLDEPIEYFYDNDGFNTSKGKPWKYITHWRHITHSLFDGMPVYSVQLPIPMEGMNDPQ